MRDNTEPVGGLLSGGGGVLEMRSNSIHVDHSDSHRSSTLEFD